jgi:hypothetical protein
VSDRNLPTVQGQRTRRWQFGLRSLLIGMTLGGAVLGVLGILTQRGFEYSRQQSAMNNLKQLGLALHNFHDARGALPAQASIDSAGQPLLSWRVHLLPYLGHDALYKRFRRSEPWDSPHNLTLVTQMPAVYQSPRSRRDVSELGPGMTCCLATVNADTTSSNAAGGPILLGTRLNLILDGKSETILLVEAAPEQAVIWTSPGDWPFDPLQPRRGLIGHRTGGFLACLADGNVRLIPTATSDLDLRRLFDPDDGFPLPLDLDE